MNTFLANPYLKLTVTIVTILVGGILLINPIAIYLSSYDTGDCDDKAAHYFSAQYAWAPPQLRNQVYGIIQQVDTSQQQPRFVERTYFRLQSAFNYPLANLTINAFTQPQTHYSLPVKYGLLTVFLIGYLVIVMLSMRKSVSIFNILLSINLGAMIPRVLEYPFLVNNISYNMLPFLSYVPRGIAALAIIPIALAVGHRKWKTLGCLLTFLYVFHLAFASLILAVIGTTLGLFSLLGIILKKKYPNQIPKLTGITGAVLFNTLFIVIVIILSASIANLNYYYPPVMTLWGMLRETALLEIPHRLSGILFVAGIFEIVLLSILIKPKLGKFFWLPSSLLSGFLGLLIYKNIPRYLWMFTGNNTFLHVDCSDISSVQFPEQISLIDFYEQATLFLSLAQFLLNPTTTP